MIFIIAFILTGAKCTDDDLQKTDSAVKKLTYFGQELLPEANDSENYEASQVEEYGGYAKTGLTFIGTAAPAAKPYTTHALLRGCLSWRLAGHIGEIAGAETEETGAGSRGGAEKPGEINGGD